MEMVESDATWRELDFRCNGGAGCVIVEKIAGCIVIRDSKNPAQPGLVFSRKEYAAFRRRVRGDRWPRAALRLMIALLRMAAFGVHQVLSTEARA